MGLNNYLGRTGKDLQKIYWNCLQNIWEIVEEKVQSRQRKFSLWSGWPLTHPDDPSLLAKPRD